MKGIIFDIKHYAIHDGPGIRTTIFFKGCPMQCLWCHNPESQKNEPEEIIKERHLDGKAFRVSEILGRWATTREIMEEVEKDNIFYSESGGGVTFSGGEPLMQPIFLEDLLDKCRERSLHTALDTCGHVNSGVFEKIMNKVDLFLYDLKIMNDEEHKKYTGVSSRLVIENLRMLVENEKDVIIRFPVIPGITDTPENMDAIKSFLVSLSFKGKIDLLPYHHIARNKYRRINREYKLNGVVEPTARQLEKLKKEFEMIGLTVGIGG